MTALTVAAFMATPIVGQLKPLDAQLSWAWAQRQLALGEEVPPMRDDVAPDFDLPLARWERDGYWGWCSSSPQLVGAHYTSYEMRRMPAVQEMARFTSAPNFHAALGPMKANNHLKQAVLCEKVVWEVECVDRTLLEELLGLVTNLGAHHRNGMGAVARWEVSDGEPGGWEKRPLPNPTGSMQRVRAPYWHPTERTPCA